MTFYTKFTGCEPDLQITIYDVGAVPFMKFKTSDTVIDFFNELKEYVWPNCYKNDNDTYHDAYNRYIKTGLETLDCNFDEGFYQEYVKPFLAKQTNFTYVMIAHSEEALDSIQ